MLTIKPSNRLFLGLVSIAAVIFLIDGYLYYNRASRLATLQREYTQKREQLQDSEQIAQRLDIVERKYNEMLIQLGALEEGVSEQAYIPSLLQQIERLGKSNNLEVTSVRPTADKTTQIPSDGDGKKKSNVKQEPYEKIAIDIELLGKYHDVVRFIKGLTNFPKIILINDINISPTMREASEKAESPILNVKLGTTAFVLKTPVRNARNEEERYGIIKKIREHGNEYQR